MKCTENGVLNSSEVFFSSPSQTAQKLHYYPISAGHFFCNKNYHLVREDYNSILIAHILNGSFTFLKSNKYITAHSGDTVIIDCHKPHEYYTNDSVEFVWLHITGGNSYDIFKEIENSFGNVLKHKDNIYIKNLFFKIIDDLNSKIPPSEINLSLDIYKIFALLLNPETTQNEHKKLHDENIAKLKIHINENLSENLTVKYLADLMHMSSSHFSRVFKQKTGYSPYDYVLISRLNKAKNLLQKTNKTVATIASETGFNSESNFIYFFTENVGISPRKFRNLEF